MGFLLPVFQQHNWLRQVFIGIKIILRFRIFKIVKWIKRDKTKLRTSFWGKKLDKIISVGLNWLLVVLKRNSNAFYVYIYTYAYIYIHIYGYIYEYIYIYMYVYMDVYMYAYVYMYMCMYACAYICMYVDMGIYMCVYAYSVHGCVYIYICACDMHMYIYVYARGCVHLSIYSALIGLFSPWGRVLAGWGSMPCGVGRALSQGGSLDAESVRDRWMQQSLRYSEIVSTLRQKLILSDFSSLSTATLFYFWVNSPWRIKLSALRSQCFCQKILFKVLKIKIHKI